MKEKVAVEDLREIKYIFDKKGVEFWLEHGTLLGAVREGKIIEWDSDIDLGTWSDYIEQIVAAFPEFKKRGFSVVLTRKKGTGTLIVKRLGCQVAVDLYGRKGGYAWIIPHIIHPTDEKYGSVYRTKIKGIEKLLRWLLNVFSPVTFTNPEGKFIRKTEVFMSLVPLDLRQLLAGVVWFVSDRRGCVIPWVVPKYFFEQLSTIQFYGMEFNIPSNVERYLEYRYGDDWRTPRKKWAFKDDGAMNLEMRLCDFLANA